MVDIQLINDGTLKKGDEYKFQCPVCSKIFVKGDSEPIICCNTPSVLFTILTNNPNFKLPKEKTLGEIYELIQEIIKDYMDLPDKYVKFISCWIIGTYFHDSFDTYPYLFFNATRGSGKTRMLKLIASLSCNGNSRVLNNITEASLFRTPKGTTLCIDEMEQIGSKEKQTLRELLNSAYKKGTSVIRMRKIKEKDGERQVSETFEPYFPIAMANIWGMEEVLADRAITFILEKSNNPRFTKMVEDFSRSVVISLVNKNFPRNSVVCVDVVTKKEYIEKWNQYIREKYSPIYDTTTSHTLTTQNDTTTSHIKMDEFFNKIDNSGIYGRNFELMFPLFIVAQYIGEDAFNDILNIASEIVKGKKEDEYSDSKDVSLLDFLSSPEISELGLQYISLKELTIKFRNFLGDSSEEDKWLNEKWIGRSLKRLNLILDRKRVASGRKVIINFVKVNDKIKIFKNVEEN